MKKLRAVFFVLMFLPLAVTLLALPLLPDQIPAHYGAGGQVDRWGSKYETLIFPAVTLAFGLVMLGLARYAAAQEKQGGGSGASNRRLGLLGGVLALGLFDLLTGYFLWAAFRRVEDLSAAGVDLSQVVFGCMGAILILLGNAMPKVRRNTVMGLRTVWSLKNDETWKRSQRFGGASLMAVGAVMLLAAAFTKGAVCFGVSMGALLLSLPADIYYTYRVAQKY